MRYSERDQLSLRTIELGLISHSAVSLAITARAAAKRRSGECKVIMDYVSLSLLVLLIYGCLIRVFFFNKRYLF